MAPGATAAAAAAESPGTPQLVWPEPPAKPRIRFLGVLRSNLDVEPRRKRTLLQRLSGAPDPNRPRSLRKPAGLATDSRGRLLVADSGQGLVFVFDRARREVSYLRSDRETRLITPLDVAVDSRDRIYVADAGAQAVLVFGPDGGLLASISDPDRLVNPAGLAIDEGRSRLYVVDSKGHRVTVFDLLGLEPIGSLGERGQGPGRFNFPVGVAVDGEGRIYVSDTGSCTVQIFNPDYQPVASLGGRGIAPSQFSRPKQIALDREGHVYVVDATFDNFQVFSRELRLLLVVGSRGSRGGEFELPFGIHIDAQNRIYVTDQVNGRVQVLQFLGGD